MPDKLSKLPASSSMEIVIHNPGEISVHRRKQGKQIPKKISKMRKANQLTGTNKKGLLSTRKKKIVIVQCHPSQAPSLLSSSKTPERPENRKQQKKKQNISENIVLKNIHIIHHPPEKKEKHDLTNSQPGANHFNVKNRNSVSFKKKRLNGPPLSFTQTIMVDSNPPDQRRSPLQPPSVSLPSCVVPLTKTVPLKTRKLSWGKVKNENGATVKDL